MVDPVVGQQRGGRGICASASTKPRWWTWTWPSPRVDREQVLRRADGGGGALGDARERDVQVVDRDQVLGGRVDVVQPLGHRGELRLERRDELLRVGGARGALGVPGDLVVAVVVAAVLAERLLDTRGGQAEQRRRLRQQARRGTGRRGGCALDPGVRARLDDGVAGPDVDARISVTVLNLVAVSATCSRIASGEPSERSSVATGVPACWRTRLLTGAPRDLRVAGDGSAALEQRHRLVVPDPVRDVVEVLRRCRGRRRPSTTCSTASAPSVARTWRSSMLGIEQATWPTSGALAFLRPPRSSDRRQRRNLDSRTGVGPSKASDPPGGAGRSREE